MEFFHWPREDPRELLGNLQPLLVRGPVKNAHAAMLKSKAKPFPACRFEVKCTENHGVSPFRHCRRMIARPSCQALKAMALSLFRCEMFAGRVLVHDHVNVGERVGNLALHTISNGVRITELHLRIQVQVQLDEAPPS